MLGKDSAEDPQQVINWRTGSWQEIRQEYRVEGAGAMYVELDRNTVVREQELYRSRQEYSGE